MNFDWFARRGIRSQKFDNDFEDTAKPLASVLAESATRNGGGANFCDSWTKLAEFCKSFIPCDRL
jgi:hypothetical protein